MSARIPHAVSFAVALWAAFLLAPAPSAAADATPFVHPQRLFSLSLPPDVVRGHPERYRTGAPDLVVRSDSGFVLSVESRRLNMPGGARAVLESLERLYLGEGKPWARREGVRPIRLGGLPGVRAEYGGPDVAAVVAVARGRNTDFLLMFFTPPALRAALAPQFDWVLERFDVAASERREAGSPLVRAPVFKAPGVFRHPRLGYTLRYPESWRAAFVPPYAAVFTPVEQTADEGIRVRIENLSPGEGIAAADTVLRRWRDDLAAASDTSDFTRVRPLVVQTPSGTRVGMTAVANYRHHGVARRQWAVVLPREGDGTVHLWRYDAPLDRFDEFRDDADEMLRTLVMEVPEAASGR